jgi:hypothetical protein
MAMSGCSAPVDTIGIVTTDSDPPSGECAPGGTLKRRPEGSPVAAISSMVENGSGDQWLLLRRGQYVTLTGQGYLNLRWQIEYRSKAGLITPPSFEAISDLFFHVGGGGGKNLGDPEPGTTGTFMGNAEEGLSYMPEGVPTPWQNEFYYLDGEVTITQQESDGLYNITVLTQSYEDLISEGWGVFDPGVVCDPE